jgi:hypothetical protein
MTDRDTYLNLDDDALLAQCEVQTYRSSGPGGQHRNKVSSAIRLRHRPTGIVVTGSERRSQHENKRVAAGRLRMEIACQVRQLPDRACDGLPTPLARCIALPRGQAEVGRLTVSRNNSRFWPAAALLLDYLAAAEGRLADAAAPIGITTSNLVSVLKDDRHLLAAAQSIRKRHGHGPLQ